MINQRWSFEYNVVAGAHCSCAGGPLLCARMLSRPPRSVWVNQTLSSPLVSVTLGRCGRSNWIQVLNKISGLRAYWDGAHTSVVWSGAKWSHIIWFLHFFFLFFAVSVPFHTTLFALFWTSWWVVECYQYAAQFQFSSSQLVSCHVITKLSWGNLHIEQD